jgi:hypothetical protein
VNVHCALYRRVGRFSVLGNVTVVSIQEIVGDYLVVEDFILTLRDRSVERVLMPVGLPYIYVACRVPKVSFLGFR